MPTQKELEREIRRIYSQARNDIGREWYAYFERGEKRLAEKEADLQAAKDAGNKAEVRRLETELKTDKENFTTRNEYYRDMVSETTAQMANANQTALAYVNGQLPSYYTQVYNSEIRAEAVDLGFQYTMVDEATVRKLVMDGDIKLPNKQIDIPKDERWNTKQINANVTQGILQGESIGKIAKRLEPIMNNNREAALRNARTLVGSAQNAGRMDRYKELAKQGAIMKKIWIATGDNRTRDWHLEMDGQTVDLNEPFVDGNGNELMFPKDPEAAPETVYNCRCTMKSKITGFVNKNTGEVIPIDYDAGTARHRAEIQKEQDRREQAKADKAAKKAQQQAQKAQKEKEKEKETKVSAKVSTGERKVVDGKDIAASWERRPDEFDFEINDVMNAQGFDGLPQVLSGREFDEAVARANGGKGFIAQRTYSGETQATVDGYADQLRNGKWYVDCSTGGAQYGQGMYCAADYNGRLTIGIEQEMRHYQSIGRMKGKNYYQTETLTLDPSARILTLPYGEDAYEYTSAKMVSEYMRKESMSKSGEVRRATKEYLSIGNQMDDINRDYMDGKITSKELFGRCDELSDKRSQIIQEHPEVKQLRDEAMDYNRKFKDAGSKAAAMGYDAINAEGHGQSGSYTVILNRTKVILKGD